MEIVLRDLDKMEIVLRDLDKMEIFFGDFLKISKKVSGRFGASWPVANLKFLGAHIYPTYVPAVQICTNKQAKQPDLFLHINKISQPRTGTNNAHTVVSIPSLSYYNSNFQTNKSTTMVSIQTNKQLN